MSRGGPSVEIEREDLLDKKESEKISKEVQQMSKKDILKESKEILDRKNPDKDDSKRDEKDDSKKEDKKELSKWEKLEKDREIPIEKDKVMFQGIALTPASFHKIESAMKSIGIEPIDGKYDKNIHYTLTWKPKDDERLSNDDLGRTVAIKVVAFGTYEKDGKTVNQGLLVDTESLKGISLSDSSSLKDKSNQQLDVINVSNDRDSGKAIDTQKCDFSKHPLELELEGRIAVFDKQNNIHYAVVDKEDKKEERPVEKEDKKIEKDVDDKRQKEHERCVLEAALKIQQQKDVEIRQQLGHYIQKIEHNPEKGDVKKAAELKSQHDSLRDEIRRIQKTLNPEIDHAKKESSRYEKSKDIVERVERETIMKDKDGRIYIKPSVLEEAKMDKEKAVQTALDIVKYQAITGSRISDDTKKDISKLEIKKLDEKVEKFELERIASSKHPEAIRTFYEFGLRVGDERPKSMQIDNMVKIAKAMPKIEIKGKEVIDREGHRELVNKLFEGKIQNIKMDEKQVQKSAEKFSELGRISRDTSKKIDDVRNPEKKEPEKDNKPVEKEEKIKDTKEVEKDEKKEPEREEKKEPLQERESISLERFDAKEAVKEIDKNIRELTATNPEILSDRINDFRQQISSYQIDIRSLDEKDRTISPVTIEKIIEVQPHALIELQRAGMLLSRNGEINEERLTNACNAISYLNKPEEDIYRISIISSLLEKDGRIQNPLNLNSKEKNDEVKSLALQYNKPEKTPEYPSRLTEAREYADRLDDLREKIKNIKNISQEELLSKLNDKNEDIKEIISLTTSTGKGMDTLNRTIKTINSSPDFSEDRKQDIIRTFEAIKMSHQLDNDTRLYNDNRNINGISLEKNLDMLTDRYNKNYCICNFVSDYREVEKNDTSKIELDRLQTYISHDLKEIENLSDDDKFKLSFIAYYEGTFYRELTQEEKEERELKQIYGIEEKTSETKLGLDISDLKDEKISPEIDSKFSYLVAEIIRQENERGSELQTINNPVLGEVLINERLKLGEQRELLEEKLSLYLPEIDIDSRKYSFGIPSEQLLKINERDTVSETLTLDNYTTNVLLDNINSFIMSGINITIERNENNPDSNEIELSGLSSESIHSFIEFSKSEDILNNLFESDLNSAYTLVYDERDDFSVKIHQMEVSLAFLHQSEDRTEHSMGHFEHIDKFFELRQSIDYDKLSDYEKESFDRTNDLLDKYLENKPEELEYYDNLFFRPSVEELEQHMEIQSEYQDKLEESMYLRKEESIPPIDHANYTYFTVENLRDRWESERFDDDRFSELKDYYDKMEAIEKELTEELRQLPGLENSSMEFILRPFNDMNEVIIRDNEGVAVYSLSAHYERDEERSNLEYSVKTNCTPDVSYIIEGSQLGQALLEKAFSLKDTTIREIEEKIYLERKELERSEIYMFPRDAETGMILKPEDFIARGDDLSEEKYSAERIITLEAELDEVLYGNISDLINIDDNGERTVSEEQLNNYITSLY